MTRLTVLMLTVMLWWTGCASAWEMSAELIDFAAEVVPGYILLDGCISDETSMLLLEDENGLAAFAGCVKTDEGWEETMSNKSFDFHSRKIFVRTP